MCEYQLELRLPTGRHTDRLDALLTGLLVIESKERLVRLHTVSTLLVYNLEG